MNKIKTIIFGLILLTIDIPWILLYMKYIYIDLLKKSNITIVGNIYTAILAYILMIISFPFLIDGKDEKKMLINSFILGLIIYGIYGFTLCSFLPNYNIYIALIEIIWGVFLYTITTKLTIIIYNYIL